ncbi:MATE family efflux transporter [Paenibacillus sp. MER 99-2]|uniref:MATE family efflux transporter n=1 Tax=Paenibacillus sp. MER 99-2 TaxID=2939572 RepID=UPI00203D1218|nr:MATE family efflux transporter [Paenibacillus sp. MER 99-2]MCM3174575.1 MATE family efflux transporter [Paenibacillus sp. MER 99-2]
MNTLTKGSPIKVIIMFTLPLLLGNIFQQLYSFIDALIVGRILGVDALAAVGATISLTSLVLGIAFGISAGLAIPTAQAFGAKDHVRIRKSFVASIWITIFVTLIITLLAYSLTFPLLRLMQTPEEIISDSAAFIQIIFLGFGASMSFNLLSNQIRALGDSRTPLIFLIISCVINVILDFWLILGFHMGVPGAALATVISQLFSTVCCVFYVRKRIPLLNITFKDLSLDWSVIRNHLGVSLPMGFQQSIIAIGHIILQTMLNTLGTTAVAAYTAASRIDQLAILPSVSFGVAMATFTAQNYGAKEFGRIRKGVHQAMILNCTISAIIGGLIIIFGRPLVNIFVGNDQPMVTELAQTYFYFNASMYWFLAILFTIRFTLQGLGQKLIPTLAGVFELIARIIAGLILIPLWGFTGAALDSPLAWIGSVLVLVFSFFPTMSSLKKKEKDQLHIRPSKNHSQYTSEV